MRSQEAENAGRKLTIARDVGVFLMSARPVSPSAETDTGGGIAGLSPIASMAIYKSGPRACQLAKQIMAPGACMDSVGPRSEISRYVRTLISKQC